MIAAAMVVSLCANYIQKTANPNKNCVGMFMYKSGGMPHTQYKLPIRYDLSSLALKANESEYHAKISVTGFGRTWVPYYNELHGTNISGTEGYVEHCIGYDLVVTKPDWVTTYIAVLSVKHKVADDEIYIVNLLNTSNIRPDGYQYVSLNLNGRCDLSNKYVKNRFREMLDNIGIASNWIDQVIFAKNMIGRISD